MKKEYLKGVSDANLLQMLANATKTQYGCHGSVKARMNENRRFVYRSEVIERGLEVPDDDHLLRDGTFNGEGSI